MEPQAEPQTELSFESSQKRSRIVASDSTVGDAGSDSNADTAGSLAIDNAHVEDGYEIVTPSVAVPESDSTLKSRPSIVEFKAQLHAIVDSHVRT